jgi:hypothetical protein
LLFGQSFVDRYDAQKRLSSCAVLGDHALKADRSLINSIMKLKADCPEIQEYLYVSQYDSLIDTSRMRLATFNLLTPIRRLPDT